MLHKTDHTYLFSATVLTHPLWTITDSPKTYSLLPGPSRLQVQEEDISWSIVSIHTWRAGLLSTALFWLVWN